MQRRVPGIATPIGLDPPGRRKYRSSLRQTTREPARASGGTV